MTPMEARARINESGRIVIPSSFREALGINPGDELVLRVEDDAIRIATLKGELRRVRALVRRYIKPGTSLSRELIEERRKVARDE